MSHELEADRRCEVCSMTIRAGIPHECNYMLCFNCSGKGTIGWRDLTICEVCKGTKKWTERE